MVSRVSVLENSTQLVYPDWTHRTGLWNLSQTIVPNWDAEKNPTVSYVVPSDGFALVLVHGENQSEDGVIADTRVSVWLNDVEVCISENTTGKMTQNECSSTILVPVVKGDVFKVGSTQKGATPNYRWCYTSAWLMSAKKRMI